MNIVIEKYVFTLNIRSCIIQKAFPNYNFIKIFPTDINPAVFETALSRIQFAFMNKVCAKCPFSILYCIANKTSYVEKQ